MAKRRHGQIPLIEWLAGAVGFVIVLGTVGYLASEALRGGAEEPVLTVNVLRVREHADSFAVDVVITNTGRAAAADVHLAGISGSGSAGERQAGARVDYVPGRSAARATLVFASHPGDKPHVRVTGYSRP